MIPPPHLDPEGLPDLILDRAVFIERLNKAKKGSAPGPSGWRNEHLQTFLSNGDAIGDLKKVAEELVNGSHAMLA